MPPTRFVPPAPFAVRPTGFVRPSGAVPDRQTILQLQAALLALNHIEAGQITGTMPIATRAQLLAFQRNYNAENRCRRHEAGAPCRSGRVYGAPYSPARIAEDGAWGNETQAALTNYIPFAQSAARDAAARQGAASQPAPSTNDVMGWGSAPGPDTSIVPIKNPRTTPATTPAPQSSTPAVRPSPAPAPQQQPASTFPTGPVIAGVVGLAVIAAAVAYKRSRKGR